MQLSNKVFKDAEAIADQIQTSMTKEGLAFTF